MIKTEKINSFFARAATLTIKFRYLNIAVFLLVFAFAFTGLGKIKTDSGWDKWVLEKSPLKLAEDEFRDIFGNNDYVAVMVEVDDIFKPEILEKIRELGNELKKKVPFSDDIFSVTDCEFSVGTEDGIEIINLVPEKIPQSEAELEKIRNMALSKELIAGKLISRDSRQSWIILRLHPFPEGWRNEKNLAPDYITGSKANEVIYQDKYRILNPRPAGMPVLATDKTDFFKKEMKKTMLLSILVSIIVLAIALRSLKGVFVSLFAAVSGIIILFGFQGHFGDPVDTSMILVPVYLGMAVSIAYSIHVFTFFNREFRLTGKRKISIIHTIEENGWPILFTALTTATGLLSSILIDVKPLQWVGAATSSIVVVILIITLVITPSLLSIGHDRKKEEISQGKHDLALEEIMSRIGSFVLRKEKITVLVFLLSVIFLAAGLYKFEVSFDIKKTMGLKVPYVKRLDYVNNSEVGSLYSYNLVVNFPEEGLARNPENLKKFESLVKTAESLKYTKKVTSIVEIIKDMNRSLNNGNNEFYRIPDTREMVAQIMLLYENAGGREAEKWIDYDYKRLRMMIELSDYNSAGVKNDIVALEKKASMLFPESEAGIAGTAAQFTFMQDIVSKGQIKSFFSAALIITLMMMAVTGSIKTGIIAMIPNIAPAIAVGGLMGWTGVPLDIFTIIIMPMLLGLAVDDTIHFLSHARLEFERKYGYRESIIRTFKKTGIPLLFSSLIISSNFLVYVSSSAKIYINLGFFTAFGILAGLVTECFVTPILINRFRPFGNEKTL